MNKRYIVALELSDSQIKGAAAYVSAQAHSSLATPVIEAIAVEDKVSCVLYGRVQNFIDASEHVKYVVQKLENDPAIHPKKITSVYVALAGRSLGSVQTTAEITLNSEMEITDEIIDRLRREATKSVPADKSVLTILPRKYYVDNQISQKPVGTMGSVLRGEFTLVTCNPTNRKMLEKVIVERVDLPVQAFVVTPLAIAAMVLSDEEKQLGCVLVDIGAQTTTIAIYKERALQYLATLPIGSHNITHDIAVGMNITEERAEVAKITQGNAIPEPNNVNEEQARINCYVQARAGELIANIGAQIGFAGFKASDLAAGMVLTGRGSKLRNLPQLIESQLKITTRQAAIPATVSVGKRGMDISDYAPLVSVVAFSAACTDHDSCVEPDSEPEEEAAAQEAKVVEQEAQPAWGSSNYNAYGGDDEETIFEDDEKTDRRREQDARRQQRDEEKRRKEEAKREKEEAKKREKAEAEERKRQEKQRQPKNGLLTTIKTKLSNLTSYNPDDGDADLDDE